MTSSPFTSPISAPAISAATIAPHGPSTGIAKAVTIEVKVTASPTERSKLPAITTKVRPIATSALTIIENKMLLRLESVRNHGDAKPKPIAVSTMTEIVPQRRSRRSHNASAAPHGPGHICRSVRDRSCFAHAPWVPLALWQCHARRPVLLIVDAAVDSDGLRGHVG